MVIPFGSGAGMGSEPVGAEACMVAVHFSPKVYSDLIKITKDRPYRLRIWLSMPARRV